jgi:tripartite ATP-independent periplasmic transporter solute receptor, DctP family
MSKSRFLALTVMAVAVLSLVFAAPVEAGQKKLIKFSHSHLADEEASEIHYAAVVFADYVNKNSPTLDVKIYASNALGSEREVFEAMQLGGGATCVISGTAILNNFDKAIGVLDLPFVWESFEHAHRVLDGKVGETLTAGLEKRGFKTLAWLDSWGFRSVVSNKEMKKPEDLKGLKIRTIETPIYIATMRIMGIDATPMSFGEVYTALQTGVIDGYEHGTSTTVAQKFYEVTKYVAETKHLFGPLIFVYSMQEWNKLTPEEQKVVSDGAALARDKQRGLSQVKDDAAKAFLIEKGMVFHPIDTTEFRKQAIGVQDKLAAERGATDLLKMLRDTK